MSTTQRPEDFGTTNCRDGITITKPATYYQVHVDGNYYGHSVDLYEAMKLVEAARAEKKAKVAQ